MNSTDKKFEPKRDLQELSVETAKVFADTIGESGRAIDAICESSRDKGRCIEHKQALIEQWGQTPLTTKSQNPLLRAAVILETVKDHAPLQWLCGRVGGVFVPDASHYGKIQLPRTAPGNLAGFPELVEWLQHMERFSDFRRKLFEFAMTGDRKAPDRINEIVSAWYSIKSWMEGFIEWTGSPSKNLLRVGAPIGPSRAVESSQILCHVFANRCAKATAHTNVIAKRLRISVSSVQKWQQNAADGHGGTATPFDHLEVLTHATNHLGMIRWLCRHVGGELRLGTVPEAERGCSWPQIYWELVELEYSVSRSLLDGDISLVEAEKVRQEWDDLRVWMARILSSNT